MKNASNIHKSVTDPLGERIKLVLRGRKAYPWAAAVGMNRGVIHRLLRGQFPDPEKLVSACRVENLSLTWLLEGIGAPYIVYTPLTADDAARHVHLLLSDEPDWHSLIVHSVDGWSVVLHQPATVRAHDGVDVEYRAVQVIGGFQNSAALLAAISHGEHGVMSIGASPGDWRRLATGYMSATELFGWKEARGGLFLNAVPFLPSVLEQRNDAGDGAQPARYDWLAPGEQDFVETLRTLTAAEREVAMRMLRGLKS